MGGEGHLEAQGSKSGTGLLPLHPFKNIHPEISMFSLHLPYGISKSLPGNKKKKKGERRRRKERKGRSFNVGGVERKMAVFVQVLNGRVFRSLDPAWAG